MQNNSIKALASKSNKQPCLVPTNQAGFYCLLFNAILAQMQIRI